MLFSLLVMLITYPSIFFYEKIILWLKTLNKVQKGIFAVIIPVILFMLFYKFIYVASGYFNFSGGTFSFASDSANIFRLNETWFFWVVYIVLVSFFEYKLFDDKSSD